MEKNKIKKLLLILLCLPMVVLAQKTYVPDDNFEQRLIYLGYDNALDDSVITANINTVTSLITNNQNISDLTGIEDFTALTDLYCSDNQLTSLDVSNNTALTVLSCWGNQLTSLDVSNNTALIDLSCNNNQLTSLDVSGATALTDLNCHSNQLTSLDVSNNTALTWLECWGNQLTSLDVRNGNNTNFVVFSATNNPSLTCINVDDWQYSLFNWGNIDPQHYFSNNCNPSAIQELTTNKELLKVTDLLGRETKQTNQPLFYIYDDGTVEKKIIIE
ncbi:MAG: leucine-rich repeat domain-containing protein [Bacteroidota bacterium]|nr:leucine-rich repeat domain-containing protein [Bacteroidota bacterium]